MSINRIGSFDFNDILIRLESSDLPENLGDLAQNHFKKNFDDEGFDGSAWVSPQRKMYGRGSKRTNPTLTDSGALRRSIKVTEANWSEIKIETVGDRVNEYAYVHNSGVGRMPKRQFMGESSELDQKIMDEIEDQLNRIFR